MRFLSADCYFRNVKKGTICTLFAFLKNVDLAFSYAVCGHFQKIKMTEYVNTISLFNYNV